MDLSDNYRVNETENEALEALSRLSSEQLKSLISRSTIRDHLLARRDALIRDVVGELFGHLQRGFAGALANCLKDFWDVGFDRDPKFDKPDEKRLREVLVANNNRTLDKRQIQNILAGHRTPLAK